MRTKFFGVWNLFDSDIEMSNFEIVSFLPYHIFESNQKQSLIIQGKMGVRRKALRHFENAGNWICCFFSGRILLRGMKISLILWLKSISRRLQKHYYEKVTCFHQRAQSKLAIKRFQGRMQPEKSRKVMFNNEDEVKTMNVEKKRRKKEWMVERKRHQHLWEILYLPGQWSKCTHTYTLENSNEGDSLKKQSVNERKKEIGMANGWKKRSSTKKQMREFALACFPG